jgi:hypothetical protein
MRVKSRGGFAGEGSVMAKVTVYYFTFVDRDTGETVRPRWPGTLDAIASMRMVGVKPLISTALEVEESELDERGFYSGRQRGLQCV